MSKEATKTTKWRDPAGNVYAVEPASNKRFVIARRNPGGNRKGVKTMGDHKTAGKAQDELDINAKRNGWEEVPE